MTNFPRGKFLGKRLGDPPKSVAEHFIRCPACGGWIDAAIWAKCSSTKARAHTRCRINRNDSRTHA